MGIQHDALSFFSWLIWYIWKARNEKVFNGKEISPLDTLYLATQEAESWRVAQVLEEVTEDLDNFPEPTEASISEYHPAVTSGISRCQVDASWDKNAKYTGFGFVELVNGVVQILGAGAKPNIGSPLHAEIAGLNWAMQSLLQQGKRAIHFESDCAQMIRLIYEEESWPLFESEMEDFQDVRRQFDDFSISFIPRMNNVRAD